ncbi:hypothetical protein HMPREF9120_02377 [Neisseria sp. oral taxon 020 str. F0370]|nr:hypothetical protein HMPREF9120_02377 [Neisseria sp. oral taxon 020 str. F0370]
MSQHKNLRRCCASPYYLYCLRLAALYLFYFGSLYPFQGETLC